jgi:gas vesicle protein
MEKHGSSTFIAGLGIGLGTGILIGLLVAPKSGSETRHVIRKSAADGEEYLEKRSAEFRETLRDLIKAVTRQRDNLTAAIEAGKAAYRKAAGRAAAEQPPLQHEGITGQNPNRTTTSADQTGIA